jgi:hypothetical protein
MSGFGGIWCGLEVLGALVTYSKHGTENWLRKECAMVITP